MTFQVLKLKPRISCFEFFVGVFYVFSNAFWILKCKWPWTKCAKLTGHCPPRYLSAKLDRALYLNPWMRFNHFDQQDLSNGNKIINRKFIFKCMFVVWSKIGFIVIMKTETKLASFPKCCENIGLAGTGQGLRQIPINLRKEIISL